MINYRKPSYHEIFMHALKCISSKDVAKKTKTGYETANSYKNITQKVFFNSSDEMLLFKSLHQGKETIDRKVKAQWVGDGKVTFVELRV